MTCEGEKTKNKKLFCIHMWAAFKLLTSKQSPMASVLTFATLQSAPPTFHHYFQGGVVWEIRSILKFKEKKKE